jgi:hypothetical protein
MYPQVRQSTINTFLSGIAPDSVLFQGEQDVDKGRSTIPLTTLTPFSTSPWLLSTLYQQPVEQ